MKTEEVKTWFIAECGGKYLYLWSEPQASGYVWYNYATRFKTREECIYAVKTALMNSEKPKCPVVITTLKETIITEVNEHGERLTL